MALFNLSAATPSTTAAKPAFSFGNSTATATANANTTNTTAPTAFGTTFGATGAAPIQSKPEPGQFGSGATSTTPQIDLEHLRNTTKWDHLQPALQEDIRKLDTSFYNQQVDSEAVGQLIKKIESEGKGLAPALDYVSTKLDELDSGLDNDAEAIVHFRDGDLKQDEAEAKCAFRAVDRMKVPRQYRTPGNTIEIAGGSSVLGASGMNSTGLTGWWNQPQTLRGTRSTSNMGGQSVQLVNDDVDDGSGIGPKNMIDLFDTRAESFRQINETQKQLLQEIEDFVEGLEHKVLVKEREEERSRQLNQLRFVFGEVQRGLFEMADKVSTTRDVIVDLGMLH